MRRKMDRRGKKRRKGKKQTRDKKEPRHSFSRPEGSSKNFEIYSCVKRHVSWRTYARVCAQLPTEMIMP